MRSAIKCLAYAVVLFIIGVVSVSCSPQNGDRGDAENTHNDENMEILGVWHHNENSIMPMNRSVIEVTKDLITIKDGSDRVKCSAGVVRFSNDAFNGGENDANSDHGFVMVKFWSGLLPYIPPGAIGEYGIIRWKNLTPNEDESEVDFLIAYSTNLLVSHVDNAEIAYSGFTSKNGHFNGLSKYKFVNAVRK